MRISSRKSILGLAAAVAVVVPAGIAWSCVALVGFRTEGPNTVQPGGTIEVVGTEFASDQPVDIRLDSPTGPVLATWPSPEPSTMTSQFRMQVPIPQDISQGEHFLVATQEHYDMNVGIPARATFYVGTSAPVAPLPQARATTLAVDDGPSAASYILIALGVAAAGLLLAAAASFVAARRPPSGSGTPERVKTP